MTRLDDYAQGGAADGGRAGGPDAAVCHRRLRGHRFRRARSALCALDLRAGPAVELGWFGSGRLSRQTRALAGCDRPLSRSDFIRGSQARSPQRRSIPRFRCGNISMRPTARSMASRRRRDIGDAPRRSPRTAVPGIYLSSAYAGFGGYTGVIQSAGACADMILGETLIDSYPGIPASVLAALRALGHQPDESRGTVRLIGRRSKLEQFLLQSFGVVSLLKPSLPILLFPFLSLLSFSFLFLFFSFPFFFFFFSFFFSFSLLLFLSFFLFSLSFLLFCRFSIASIAPRRASRLVATRKFSPTISLFLVFRRLSV